MNLLSEAKDIQEQIQNWRRDLHQIPEIGFDLPKTQMYVKNALDQMNISYQECKDNAGIVVLLGSGQSPCVAIRADMDALPISENTGLSYASKNGNMHACGHDSHTASLLGIAKLLKNHEAEIHGTIKLIFQPAEEAVVSGALSLVHQGVLENPKVDAIFGLHVTPDSSYPAGDILLNFGPVCTAEDAIDLKIIGRGGHASMPYKCIDPIAVMTMTLNNLQYIISREISPKQIAVLSFATIEAGSGADNIIPDTVRCRGTLRTGDEKTREYVKIRIQEIVEHTCTMMKAEYDLGMSFGLPAVENNLQLTAFVQNIGDQILGKESMHKEEQIWMASEDFSFYTQNTGVKGCYIRFAGQPDGCEVYALHNEHFVINDEILYRPVALLAQAALEWRE